MLMPLAVRRILRVRGTGSYGVMLRTSGMCRVAAVHPLAAYVQGILDVLTAEDIYSSIKLKTIL